MSGTVVKTNKGETLSALSEDKKLLLVFLRHFGCTFCRETMAEIAKERHEIERNGLEIVLVHMVDSQVAAQILSVYDLHDLRHISDPHQALYRRFGLGKVSFKALFGIRNWHRAFIAGLLKGHLVGKAAGDPFQMPGVFVFHKNKILDTFDYSYVSDMPKFTRMADAAQA